MKIITRLIAAASFFLSAHSFADVLLCASAKNQVLYFSEGQLLLRAEIAGPTLLENVDMSLKHSNLGFSEDELNGKVSGNWVRFQASDAWCNYTLTLPESFMTQERSAMFVDAHCDEDTQYSIKMKCSVE